MVMKELNVPRKLTFTDPITSILPGQAQGMKANNDSRQPGTALFLW